MRTWITHRHGAKQESLFTEGEVSDLGTRIAQKILAVWTHPGETTVDSFDGTTVRRVRDVRATPETLGFREAADGAGRDVHIVLVSSPGLGDVLLSIPIAYSLKEHYPDSAISVQPATDKKYSFPITNPDPRLLPTLPLLSRIFPNQVARKIATIDLREGPHVDAAVRAGTSLLEGYQSDLGVRIRSTPRTAWLRHTKTLMRRAEALVGKSKSSGFLLIAPAGHFAATKKRMSARQIRAIVAFAASRNLRPVLVHDKAMPAPSDCLNLSGQTGLEDLIALCACARLVVSTDSGPMHLAANFGTPTIGLFGDNCRPEMVASQYRPFLSARAERVREIPVRKVAELLDRMLRVTESPVAVIGPDRRPCGVAEHGRELAHVGKFPFYRWGPQPREPVAILEYHAADYRACFDAFQAARQAGALVVLDVHNPGRETDLIAQADAVVLHNAVWYEQVRGLSWRAWYLPLHTMPHKSRRTQQSSQFPSRQVGRDRETANSPARGGELSSRRLKSRHGPQARCVVGGLLGPGKECKN